MSKVKRYRRIRENVKRPVNRRRIRGSKGPDNYRDSLILSTLKLLSNAAIPGTLFNQSS